MHHACDNILLCLFLLFYITVQAIFVWRLPFWYVHMHWLLTYYSIRGCNKSINIYFLPLVARFSASVHMKMNENYILAAFFLQWIILHKKYLCPMCSTHDALGLGDTLLLSDNIIGPFIFQHRDANVLSENKKSRSVTCCIKCLLC